jgi:predicted dehydrogenase
MDQVRTGIIGIGNMGSAHAMTIYNQKVEGMLLTAVCDCNEDRLQWAREYLGDGIAFYKDYHLMIASKCMDAVIIATPHLLHPAVAIDSFAAGLHVLTEKPAGIDTLHVKEMNQAAKVSGKVFAIMLNQRTNPLYAKLQQMLQNGELGELKRFVWIVNNWYRSQAYYDSGDWRATWSGEGGGVLLNQCPHNLDIWQWITGMPVKIRAFCQYGHYHRINVEDDVTIYAEYANHASAVFISSTGEYPGTNRLEISTTKGKAVIENKALTIHRLNKDERDICYQSEQGFPEEEITVEKYEQQEDETGHTGVLQNFTNAILFGEELLSPGVEGIKGLTISNAAYLSDWTNAWVDIPMQEDVFYKMLQEKQLNEKEMERNIKKEEMKGEYSERWDVRW